MCPPVEDTPANGTNGHANGSNGNGDHPGYSAIQAPHNPHPHHKSPYQPVGDFLSNVGNFKIIESTLREGEQFAKWVSLCPMCACVTKHVPVPTLTWTPRSRLPKPWMSLASTVRFSALVLTCLHALTNLADIELTSPAASEQSRRDCETICKLGLKAKILTHVRCNMEDAKIAVETGVDGLDVVIGTSSYLREHSHGKDMTYIKNTALEVIKFVKSKGKEIRFSSEDSFRSDLVDLLSIYSAVDKVGVNRVGIADTVGCASPRQVVCGTEFVACRAVF